MSDDSYTTTASVLASENSLSLTDKAIIAVSMMPFDIQVILLSSPSRAENSWRKEPPISLLHDFV